MSSLRVLISAEQIQARIRELGAEIDRDYPKGPVYLIAILKGACFFLADLARAMKTPARIEFLPPSLSAGHDDLAGPSWVSGGRMAAVSGLERLAG